MDPGRHHDFVANNTADERTSRNTYYGRDIPEITAHQYYGPATTTTRPINSNTTQRKPCGCTTTGSGSSSGCITCNGCRLSPAEEGGGGWSQTNQPPEHIQRGAPLTDYHRMTTDSSIRSNVRQSSMYMQQQHSTQHAQTLHQQSSHSSSSIMPTKHTAHIGTMSADRQSYWPQSGATAPNTTQPYAGAGEDHLGSSSQPPTQSQVDISVTRRTAPNPNEYPYKSSGAPPSNSSHSNQHLSSGVSYQLPTSSVNPSNTLHSRVNAMVGATGPPSGPTRNPYHTLEQQRTFPASVMYDSHLHHMNSQAAMGKNLAPNDDHHVINPSNLPPSKEQHSSPASSVNTSNNLHSRVSTIGGATGPPSVPKRNSFHTMEPRIFDNEKYFDSLPASASKLPYKSSPASAIYDSHLHHMNSQAAIGKNLPPIDHHVINPSNLPTSKEQQPSPNYARKCPQMYAPEEQTTAHQHLYMSTPQFSSDKFTRASPQHQQQPPPAPPSDYTKLRESPSGNSYMVAPNSDKYGSPHLQSSHLRESPHYATHASPTGPRNPSSSSSYYANSQTQNPSKIHPPDSTPIIMKQSPHYHHPATATKSHHYQYSKSPLAPPLPPSHMHQQPQQHQQSIPPPSTVTLSSQQMAAKAAPPPGHSQRYLMDNVKREDLEIYENPHQTPTRLASSSSNSGIYINPYNTPPPTGDSCCKDVALSASSSPYTTGSATPNYRVESPQFYPTKYAKLVMNENLSSSSKHSLINQNTPPPSRAPSQRGGHQQANYYYEGNSHSAPSPAAATAASPSPSSLLATTSQTPMHHTEYMSSALPPGSQIGPPPAQSSQLVGSANMPTHAYASQPTLAAQHQHQPPPSSASLRHNDLMITAVQPSVIPPPSHAPTHPAQTSHSSYERVIHHPNQPTVAAAVGPMPPIGKHVLTHSSSTGSLAAQPAIASTNSNKPLAKHQKPNYRDLINQTLAMRNATSEEELNRQIIKKTLNVDPQNIRAPPTGSTRGIPPLPTQPLQVNERKPTSSLREPITKHKSVPAMGSVLVGPSSNALSMPSTGRIIEVPDAMPQRICIKQEDVKPSSSSGTTSSSPLDLSMRTVKTKADSTDYKYQQRTSRLPTAASSTTPGEGRYTLPRVDSTPIFSVHAFEPGVANNRPTSSRHSSLERRNYTPPSQAQQIAHSPAGLEAGAGSPASGSPYHTASSTQHIPNSSNQTTHPYGANSTSLNISSRRNDLPPSQSYENSLVIKTAPKLNKLNSDLVVRPSTITGPPLHSQNTSQAPISRPSVVETNPYATVIKTETKRFNEPSNTVTPQHTLAAVERLPPDTSIMALPARNPYGVVRSAIQTNNNVNNNNISSSNPSPQPNYPTTTERNPNFRKRHLQEYSQQMSLNEPEAKHKRYSDVTTPGVPPTAIKPQIPMRPADISVIAVNEVINQEERKSLLAHKPNITEDLIKNKSVIASTTTNNISPVIVNNVNHSPLPSSSVLMVCKQEPITPTGEGPHINSTTMKPATNEMPPSTFSSRIRTKAELKGFTFNPPPPPPVTQTTEVNNSPPSPSHQVNIKQEDIEDEDIQATSVQIKQEIVAKIELPTIPGLDEEFEEKNLLDFGWNDTCNHFMEQLSTRPSPKKKPSQLIVNNKDPDMVVSSTENMVMENSLSKNIQENHNLSNFESADNTTRSSFTRQEAGVESSLNFNNINQDSLNSQGSGFNHKKLSKTEREKKRFNQEKRLAERLKTKESSSETEDELDKRKTERLKKPLLKAKHKLKSPKAGANSSSSTSLNDKNRFSDCGSDSSGTEMEDEKQKTKSILKEIKQEKMEVNENDEKQDEQVRKEKDQLKNNEKCDIKTKEQEKEEDKKKLTNKSNKTEIFTNKKETTEQEINKIKQEPKSNTETSEEEDEDEDNDAEEEEEEEHEDSQKDEDTTKTENKSKTKLNKQSLNTMTRSKRKQELEQQLANSKVLRNDKIIRNFSNANSSNKIKRKYTRKYNTVNSLLESGGLSRESGIMKSTRLKAKLERNGGKLNLIKSNKNKNNLKNINGKDSSSVNKVKSPKTEHEHDRNVLDLYRFKRALKVPPSLINIKHPGAHKIAASLPDLERHAEALEAYAKKREKNCLKQNKMKSKSNKQIKTESGTIKSQNNDDQEEPQSIIDLLHSRVTKASGMNVRNKTTTTTAVYRPTKPCCTTSSNNNCGMFSETSQTTESSELQMLPELKKDSESEDNEDNDSTNGKKRHFSIFDTKVLPTKTRTESKLQQKKENIREIFVGDDRPASAPPEMTQILDSSEKMTYEQKYEQFLQQMNIVVSADTLGRLSKSAAAKRLGNTTNGNQDLSNLNIKQEEGDTESTSVIDADDLKEDQKSLPNHYRKKRGRYLRRKGSSGFDYIRKKKKPSTNSSNNNQNSHNNQVNNNGSLSNLTQFSIKSEKYDMDEYEHKMKTEDDVSREIQKWVLNKGVGQSAMHKAARQGYIDVIVYCLDRMGMNPDQKDNAGYTPLHEACTNGWLNIARVLLQYGANHSEAAHSGIRPLHEASENDHEEIVRLLLSYGADPLLATYAGQTPLMLASSKTMRDILSNHLIDVQSMGPDRKPWRFNGPWEIYDPSECGYNVFEGAPNSVCDTSRALLRRGSLTANNQIYQNNKKLQNMLNTTTNTTSITATTTTAAAEKSLTNATTAATASTSATVTSTVATVSSTAAVATTTTSSNLSSTTATTTSSTTATGTSPITSNSSAILNNSNTNNNNAASSSSSSATSSSSSPSTYTTLSQTGIDNNSIKPQTSLSASEQQHKIKGETSTKTVMEKCAVVLDNIDRFNSVRLYNDNKPEILVENSDSDGEMFEFEEADVLLPPLYLLKDEGTQDKWVLLNDLCNLLKVKSKDTLLNKIYPSSASSPSSASAHKSHMRELKMSDFLEKATCLQLLCAGEKLNICASKVVLIKYNENVRNLLGVKTILMKF